MDSRVIFLFDPNQTPFGQLSPNYQDSQPIKYKSEEASSVISYAYGGLVPISEKGPKDYILKQAKMQEVVDYTNSLLTKHLNRIFLDSIKKAYNEKLNDPRFVKYLIQYGTKSILKYKKDEDLVLGVNEDGKGDNLVGKMLSELRDNKIKNLYDVFLLNTIKKENELKYKIHAVYSMLERKFVVNTNFLINNNKLSGVDGLSFYSGKSLDELVNLLGIPPLNDKLKNTVLNEGMEIAYYMPDKIVNIIRVLNYKKYNERILNNDKILVRRNYLLSLSGKNISDINSFVSSLSQDELRELDDRLYFYASMGKLDKITTSKLNFITEESISEEKRMLEKEYERRMEILSENRQLEQKLIKMNEKRDKTKYMKFIDYILLKLYDPKYIDILLRAFNSIIFSNMIDIDSKNELDEMLNKDYHKNFEFEENEEGEYILKKKHEYSYFNNAKDIEDYIKSQEFFTNIMALSYPFIKDLLSIQDAEDREYSFYDSEPISPEFKELFSVENFLFPSVLHYAYYNMNKEIAKEIIDYNNIEKSAITYSHDLLLLNDRGSSSDLDNYKSISVLKKEFDDHLRSYKSIILKRRAKIALEMKFDNLFMKKLLVSTENKKLLYNNPKDNILGCVYKDDRVKGDNFIGEEMEKMRSEFRQQIGEVTIEKIDEVYYFYYYVNGALKLEPSGMFGEKTTKMVFDDNFDYMMGRVKEFIYILHLYNSFFIKSKNIDLPEVRFIINNLYSRCYKTLEDLSVKVPPVPKDFFDYVKDYSNLYQKYFISKEAVIQLWKSVALFDMLYRSDMDNERINNTMLNVIKNELIEESKNYDLDFLDNRNLSVILHSFVNVFEKMKRHNDKLKMDRNSLSFIYYLISSRNEKEYIGKYKEDKNLESKLLGKIKDFLYKNKIQSIRDDDVGYLLFLMTKLSKSDNDLSRALFFADISRFDTSTSPKKEDEEYIDIGLDKKKQKEPKDIFDDFNEFEEEDEKDILNKKIRARYGYQDEEEDENKEEGEDDEGDEDGYDVDNFEDEDADEYGDDM